jgi:hypothetical protein
LPRRTFLRGVLSTGAATTVALPVLDGMLDTNGALADGSAFPDRFVQWFWGNGNIPGTWAPATQGPGWEPSPFLRGLGAVREKVSVISGATLPALRINNPHIEGVVGILGGTNPVIDASYEGVGNDWDFMTYAGPTIDEIAAGVVGPAPYRSLVIALTKLRESFGPGTAVTYTSHKGPNFYNPPIFEPGDLFDLLFAEGAPVFGAPTADERARATVLDAVLEDARSLDRRLSAPDRERLEHHLDSIRELEIRLSGRIGQACESPTRIDGRPVSDRENGRLMSELVALAFACDLSRVASITWSSPASEVDFPDAFPDGLIQNGAPTSFHVYVHDNGPTDVVLSGYQYFIDALVTSWARSMRGSKGRARSSITAWFSERRSSRTAGATCTTTSHFSSRGVVTGGSRREACTSICQARLPRAPRSHACTRSVPSRRAGGPSRCVPPSRSESCFRVRIRRPMQKKEYGLLAVQAGLWALSLVARAMGRGRVFGRMLRMSPSGPRGCAPSGTSFRPTVPATLSGDGDVPC